MDGKGKGTNYCSYIMIKAGTIPTLIIIIIILMIRADILKSIFILKVKKKPQALCKSPLTCDDCFKNCLSFHLGKLGNLHQSRFSLEAGGFYCCSFILPDFVYIGGRIHLKSILCPNLGLLTGRFGFNGISIRFQAHIK